MRVNLGHSSMIIKSLNSGCIDSANVGCVNSACSMSVGVLFWGWVLVPAGFSLPTWGDCGVVAVFFVGVLLGVTFRGVPCVVNDGRTRESSLSERYKSLARIEVSLRRRFVAASVACSSSRPTSICSRVSKASVTSLSGYFWNLWRDDEVEGSRSGLAFKEVFDAVYSSFCH